MKKYFVEITIGVYMDEMDDNNSPESAAEIADAVINEAIDNYWTREFRTEVVRSFELPEPFTSTVALDVWQLGALH